MRYTVDTNVPIVANGRGTNASDRCRLSTIEFLERLLHRGRIYLDQEGEIQKEYHIYLNPHGQPGVGDRFYLAILQSSLKKIERVSLVKDSNGDYFHFPSDDRLAGFDPSDKKFAALSRFKKIPVATATDSDWHIHKDALEANGIIIEFLCGANPES